MRNRELITVEIANEFIHGRKLLVPVFSSYISSKGAKRPALLPTLPLRANVHLYEGYIGKQLSLSPHAQFRGVLTLLCPCCGDIRRYTVIPTTWRIRCKNAACHRELAIGLRILFTNKYARGKRSVVPSIIPQDLPFPIVEVGEWRSGRAGTSNGLDIKSLFQELRDRDAERLRERFKCRQANILLPTLHV